jgi:hypothetical protein
MKSVMELIKVGFLIIGQYHLKLELRPYLVKVSHIEFLISLTNGLGADIRPKTER